MRKAIFLMTMLALLLPLLAGAQVLNPALEAANPIIGQTFKVTALDTLWFTKACPEPAATATLAQWLGATDIYVAKYNSSDRRTVSARVDALRLYAAKPFARKVFGGGNSGLNHVIADTLVQSGAVGDFSVLYPCEAWVTFPDSLRITPAESDTVFIEVRYKVR